MKNYSRCVICDYLEGHGSELHDIPNRWNKRVKWRTKHNEYQCDDCYNSIKEVNYKNHDYSSNEFLFDDAEQEDCTVPPALSPLHIK